MGIPSKLIPLGKMKRLIFIALLVGLAWGQDTVTDIDGNVYETIQIGDQLWMTENLKVTHYNDGTEIPTGYSDDDWAGLSTGAYAVYGDNESNADTYGYLYNWYAVDDDRGVCPASWHVPTDGEYTELSDYLGGTSVAGGKLKECTEGSCPESEYWYSPNTGATNESGFTALPGGAHYYYSGNCRHMGYNGSFWSSTEYGSNDAWHRGLESNHSEISRRDYGKDSGFSLRCIRDETETGTILVPQDYPTIQAGIDAASDGDTVLVSAGTYVENINCSKSITIAGSGIDSTFVDGGGNNRVFDFSIGGTSLIIEDLTVQNGVGEQIGGGFKIETTNANQTDININRCHFLNNQTVYLGGGLEDIKGGGAIYIGSNTWVTTDTININDCIFTNNYAVAESDNYTGIGYGGAINLYTGVHLAINNSTFFGNIAGAGGGNSILSTTCTECLVVSNSILFDETPVLNGGVSTQVSFSNINGGWEGEGNIDANPFFCNPDSGDYTLAENSPCVGTGENGANMGAFGVGCEAINLAPVLTTIEDQQIAEDSVLTIGVSATSILGYSMSFTATSDTSDVEVSLEDTNLTATPSLNWFGSSVITVIATDENELFDTTGFTLTVNAVNDAPVAYDDTIMVDPNTDFVGALIASDVDDMEYSFYLLNNPSNGIVTVSVEGSFVYSPTTDYSGSDSFTFIVCDYSLCDTATILITIHPLSIDEASLPTEYAIHQNYPNPFNPVTTLRYDLPENALVNITIYDMLGREVKTLINQTQDAGYKSIIWDATNDYGKPVSAGIYLYQIQAGEYISTKKMVLLK